VTTQATVEAIIRSCRMYGFDVIPTCGGGVEFEPEDVAARYPKLIAIARAHVQEVHERLMEERGGWADSPFFCDGCRKRTYGILMWRLQAMRQEAMRGHRLLEAEALEAAIAADVRLRLPCSHTWLPQALGEVKA